MGSQQEDGIKVGVGLCEDSRCKTCSEKYSGTQLLKRECFGCRYERYLRLGDHLELINRASNTEDEQ